MGSHLSKLKPIHYTCHELAHTWDPSCTWSALEMGEACFKEALKIYGTVYGVSTLLKGRLPTRAQMIALLKNVLQSSLFLTYNTFGYVTSVCFIGMLLGSYNYYTLGWLAGFMSSFIAINFERESRRSMLAVYVSNVASESLLESSMQSGYLPRFRNGETLAFACISSVVMYLYKSSPRSLTENQDPKHEDILLKGARYLVGPSEGFYSTQDGKSLFQFTLTLVRSFWGKTDQLLHPKDRNKVCLHKESSCFLYGIKGFLIPFGMGQIVQTGLLALKMIQGRRPKSFFALLTNLVSPRNLRWGAFLGSFPAIYKLTSCLLRNVLEEDHRLISVPAGFMAGLSMVLFPSPSLCMYALWKTLEILVRQGVKDKRLPQIPFGVELLYAFSTSILLHLSVVSPPSLKPSYWKFLRTITGQRLLELNRPLLDHHYQVHATSMLPDFRPDFPNLDVISRQCLDISWPT